MGNRNALLRQASRFFKRSMRRVIRLPGRLAVYAFLPFFAIVSILASTRKRNKIGIGPDPLINNVYHKLALESQGYRAETFVRTVYFITDKFDKRFDLIWAPVRAYAIFLYSIWNYSCIYIYFTGGPLGYSPLRKLEPWLLKLAKVRVVVMPYGADVQDVLRSSNLLYRHALFTDYPHFQRSARAAIVERVDRWLKRADCVISGCDWVFYLSHWDVLMLAHFSIDLSHFIDKSDEFVPDAFTKERPLRLLHAPNHRTIKGSRFFIEAVRRMKEDGCHVELEIIEKQPNDVVKERIANADVVLDQLVIGWYAMFALEALASGKPVVCFLDPELLRLYRFAGLLQEEKLPIIQADFETIEGVLRDIYSGKTKLVEYKKGTRSYVEKHHSIHAIGKVFASINERLGVPK